MKDHCYIAEEESGFTLHFSDGSTSIPGQPTEADAVQLARLNGYTLIPPPEQASRVDVAIAGKPAFHCTGAAGFVAEQLRQFLLQHGMQ